MIQVCPHGCGKLQWNDDQWVCPECGDEWPADNVRLGKRRYHPGGWTIYDVTLDERWIGSVTHPEWWHAYDTRGEPVAVRGTRYDAVQALVESAMIAS